MTDSAAGPLHTLACQPMGILCVSVTVRPTLSFPTTLMTN